MIDITVERGFFLLWTNEDGVDPDDPTARADHFDLLVADVALDVVIAPRIGMGNDQRPIR